MCDRRANGRVALAVGRGRHRVLVAGHLCKLCGWRPRPGHSLSAILRSARSALCMHHRLSLVRGFLCFAIEDAKATSPVQPVQQRVVMCHPHFGRKRCLLFLFLLHRMDAVSVCIRYSSKITNAVYVQKPTTYHHGGATSRIRRRPLFPSLRSPLVWSTVSLANYGATARCCITSKCA